MRIGFIGLGNMGLPMAKNLAEAGHEIIGFDVTDQARKAAEDAGIALAKKIEETVSGSDCVITMLPNGAIARQVASDILPVAAKDLLHIDCSTIDVKTAGDLHNLAVRHNVLALDAPVSGGISGAAAGTLTFMVGGSEAAFEKGKPLFDIMGQKAVLCGDGGAGQATKICNNMLLAISMIGTCEAFSLGRKLGLDPAKLFDVVSTASGSCWSVNTYCPLPGVGPQSPADNDYKPGFAAELMVKDTGLAMEAAQQYGAVTPLGDHAAALYQAMTEAGLGTRDFSAMIEYLESQTRKDDA